MRPDAGCTDSSASPTSAYTKSAALDADAKALRRQRRRHGAEHPIASPQEQVGVFACLEDLKLLKVISSEVVTTFLQQVSGGLVQVGGNALIDVHVVHLLAYAVVYRGPGSQEPGRHAARCWVEIDEPCVGHRRD